MPTIPRVGPYRFFFYSNEGDEPPHIHVQRDRSVGKFWLDPVRLASSRRFGGRALREIETLVNENRDTLLDAWNDFFGA